MREGIHPTYFPDALVVCGTCGATWHAGSTKKEIHLDICSNCHPFFTGTQRIVDTAGQVERFSKRLAARETLSPEGEVRASKKQRRAAERAKRSGVLEAEAAEAEAAEAAARAAAQPAAEAATEAPAAEAGDAPAASAPRERKPRPPRERKPREAKPADAAPEGDANA